MKAVCWYGPGDVRVAEVPRPSLQAEDDVILRVTRAAVCGSDLHALHGKIPQLAEGTILGHEFVGVVEEVGPAVRRLRPGQRTAAAMFVACGRCPQCLAGQHPRCSEYAMFGMGRFMGGLAGAQAEFVRVPLADMTLFPIPDAMEDEAALFTGDILATAYTACRQSGIGPGDLVAIVGAGPVGLLAVSCARLLGAAQVFTMDPIGERRELAQTLGAHPIDPGQGDPVDALRQQTGGPRANVVIEAVGNQSALELAWRLAATGATVALVGILIDESWPQSAGRAWLRNLTVQTVVGQPYRHRQTLFRLIASGALQPQALISQSVPLSQAATAYSDMDSRRTLKPVLRLD
ncbi:MAG: alcohol dehydrogenase catalytic domain-containing protein [Candidatus Dormibacteria bacterium]